MFEKILTQLRTYIEKYPAVRGVLGVLARTPAHALHWYGVLFLSIGVVIVTVLLAGFVFRGAVQSGLGSEGAGGQPATINRDDLRAAIDVFEARELEFTRTKQISPEVIDPGR